MWKRRKLLDPSIALTVLQNVQTTIDDFAQKQCKIRFDYLMQLCHPEMKVRET